MSLNYKFNEVCLRYQYYWYCYEPSDKQVIHHVKLSEIITTELLAKEVAAGFINCSPHPDDPSLKILCYGKLTQILGHWNEATKQCRGLIVRAKAHDFSDAEVVARPWRKFFTLQQVQSGWALGDEEGGRQSRQTSLLLTLTHRQKSPINWMVRC